MITSHDIRRYIGEAYVGSPHPTFLLKGIETLSLNDIGTAQKTDLLGRAYFMDFEFTYQGKTMKLPNEPLISVSARNNIVKTAVVGADFQGTVKEFISADDYVISITGVCLDPLDRNRYPTEQVAIINTLAGAKESVEVDNQFLNLFGVYQLVIEEVHFAEMEGKQGSQAFHIRAVSDFDFFAERKHLKPLKTQL